VLGIPSGWEKCCSECDGEVGTEEHGARWRCNVAEKKRRKKKDEFYVANAMATGQPIPWSTVELSFRNFGRRRLEPVDDLYGVEL